MSEGIKKGDMVRLKSGGPRMMVTYVGKGAWGGDDDQVWCEWFDDKNVPQKKDFLLTSVELVPQSPKGPLAPNTGSIA